METHNFPTDYSIDGIYHQLNKIHTQISQNRENIAILSSKLDLATSQNISDMLVNISNLKFGLSTVENNIKLTETTLQKTINELENKLDTINGQFNQTCLSISTVKKDFKDFKEELQKESDEKKLKFFSWGTCREILIAVVIAMVLAVGGGICKTIWESYIERETAHRTPQIQFTQGQQQK